jgi:cysteine desulfurase/selenocysteine lyase
VTQADGGEPERPPDTSGALDAAALRAQFPILQRTVHGRPLVYLDTAATSQKPEAVIRALDDFYRHTNANVHRGVHALSAEATESYEAARTTVAGFVGAADRREVVFTRGTTEAINLVAATWGVANVRAGDAVLCTQLEHHSNLVPWQLLAERTGAELRYLPMTDEGCLDLGALDRLLDGRVKLLAVGHVSNALGTINPVRTLVDAAHAVGALALVDAAQSVPHMPVSVADLGADFLAFSGHKMCGPTGIGALWGRYELLRAMPPYQGGGEMIRSVTLEGSSWAEPPARFEAGTPAIAQAVGLAEAVRFLQGLGMEKVRQHGAALLAYAMERLDAVPGVTILGPRKDRSGSVSFVMEGVHPHDVASILDRRGIAIRAGHHCAMPAHTRLGLAASARASFYVYNTSQDVDALAEGLLAARAVFARA